MCVTALHGLHLLRFEATESTKPNESAMRKKVLLKIYDTQKKFLHACPTSISLLWG